MCSMSLILLYPCISPTLDRLFFSFTQDPLLSSTKFEPYQTLIVFQMLIYQIKTSLIMIMSFDYFHILFIFLTMFSFAPESLFDTSFQF